MLWTLDRLKAMAARGTVFTFFTEKHPDVAVRLEGGATVEFRSAFAKTTDPAVALALMQLDWTLPGEWASEPEPEPEPALEPEPEKPKHPRKRRP